MIDGLILQLGGIPGGPELLLIVLLAVLLFGANKIPKLARSTGQAMGEFQKGRQQVEEELEEMKDGAESPESASADSTTQSSSDSDTDTETQSN
ncbi:twin-arginine translocase TatA/TatE family subunit [Halorhabdus sp. CBA1104]|uniref:Sec-independent protein translocase subunit TatA/TatB n=1 Tax=unclassified Halorhabdus TaxID=2621901 RepID=UPI0012B1FF1A|nr:MULTISPECIES: twin-arginine translocase TatA/TatE family subunit [unclassified Halorhabdus]QGN07051.1 twin-arginine translocase TatA/TatE family subunit [Halorhabdus sp. CBA1104]